LHIRSNATAATANSIFLQNQASGGSEGVSIVFNPMFGSLSRIASNREGGSATDSNLSFWTYAGTTQSEVMRITSKKNILVGRTIDSSYKVDVVGNARFTSSTFGFNTDSLLVDNASGDSRSVKLFLGEPTVYNTAFSSNTITSYVAGISFNFYSGNWTIGATRTGGADVHGLVLARNGVERFVIDNTGRVGIGTTVPDRALTVHSAGSSVMADFKYTAGGFSSIILSNTNGAAHLASVGNDLLISPGGTERVRVTNTGNVGIGTTSPTDTNSYGRALDIQSNAGAAVYFRDSDDTTKYFLSGFAGQTTNHGVIGTWGVGTLLRIFTSGDEKVRIESGGNVLIGTTTNSIYKLDVNGSFRTTSTINATLANVSTANVVYYNTANGLFTYGAAPSGGGGTVTSVAMTVPTGLSISGSPITGAGTLAVSLSAGYIIPLTASTTNWETAYGWGNHASAGYLGSSAYNATTTHAAITDLPALNTYPAFSIASSTWMSMAGLTASSTIQLKPAYTAETWSGIRCATDTGTALIKIGDGTNWMTTISASTTVGLIAVSSNNTFTAGEVQKAVVSNISTTTNWISCSVSKKNQ
jgi:hypothetical protein